MPGGATGFVRFAGARVTCADLDESLRFYTSIGFDRLGEIPTRTVQLRDLGLDVDESDDLRVCHVGLAEDGHTAELCLTQHAAERSRRSSSPMNRGSTGARYVWRTRRVRSPLRLRRSSCVDRSGVHARHADRRPAHRVSHRTRGHCHRIRRTAARALRIASARAQHGLHRTAPEVLGEIGAAHHVRPGLQRITSPCLAGIIAPAAGSARRSFSAARSVRGKGY